MLSVLIHGKLFSVAHAKKLLGSYFLRFIMNACVFLSIVRILRSFVYKALMSGVEEKLVFSMIDIDLVNGLSPVDYQ